MSKKTKNKNDDLSSRIEKAILEIQSTVNLEKSATADTGKYTYSYVPLDKVHEAIRPILFEYGLYTSFPIKDMVMHLTINGKKISEFDLNQMIGDRLSPAQEIGAATTYARRYLIVNFFDLDAEEDTDANVSGRAKNRSSNDNGNIVEINGNKFKIKTINTKKGKQTVVEDLQKKNPDNPQYNMTYWPGSKAFKAVMAKAEKQQQTDPDIDPEDIPI